MDLSLVASELSMVIFENDNLEDKKVQDILCDYLQDNYGEQISVSNYDFIIDTAYKIYEKM